MRTKPPDTLPIFRSDLQASLLAALFLRDAQPLTAKQLADETGGAPASVYRELTRLVEAGLVERDREERGAGFRAVRDSPLYAPLRELLDRTLGVEPQLRRALAAVEGVEDAAIFGSWADRSSRGDSDIDLMVVGDVDRTVLLVEVKRVENQVGREIDVTAYGRDEFDRRRDEGSGFIRTVLRGPLIQLIGEVE